MRDTVGLAESASTVRSVLVELEIVTQKRGKHKILHEVRNGRAVTAVYLKAKAGGTISKVLRRFWDDEVRLKFNEELSMRSRHQMYRKVEIDDESVIVMEVEGYSADTVRRHVKDMLRRYDEFRLSQSDGKLMKIIERIIDRLGLNLRDVVMEDWRDLRIAGGDSEHYSSPHARG